MFVNCTSLQDRKKRRDCFGAKQQVEGRKEHSFKGNEQLESIVKAPFRSHQSIICYDNRQLLVTFLRNDPPTTCPVINGTPSSSSVTRQLAPLSQRARRTQRCSPEQFVHPNAPKIHKTREITRVENEPFKHESSQVLRSSGSLFLTVLQRIEPESIPDGKLTERDTFVEEEEEEREEWKREKERRTFTRSTEIVYRLGATLCAPARPMKPNPLIIARPICQLRLPELLFHFY